MERAGWTFLGVCVCLAGWAYLAAGEPEYMLPSPVETGRALVDILAAREFWTALGQTIGRGMTGLSLAILGGVVWGYATGKWVRFDWLCRGLLQILLSTPAIIFVIVGIVWYGANGSVVVFVVAIVTMPVLTTATSAAVRAIDADLLEMARIFGVSRTKTALRVTFPTVAVPVLAATTVALGQSIRVSVMAELLATASGIGGAIRLAQLNIATPDVFAYAVVMTAVTFTLEAFLVAPIRKRMQAYRENLA